MYRYPVPSVSGARTAPSRQAGVDPVLERTLRIVVVAGLLLVALLPAARMQGALGWPPLWLVGMPLSAWWALHRFRVPAEALAALPSRTRRRRGPQARRRRVRGPLARTLRVA